ncbi:CAP domain-containing protein [Streptomyces mangrovisoli]|uniref:Stress protein n=1 Tax=Streptomyces mangrovisoli TaxID=1428628 RepID=A0A1J4NZD8_9ACTN|nr:CAP domain-containing protein [Streptomyces mangrovisoli]OIJ66542.1 stress protein [Streptomyces mangrovisoli]
MSELVPGGNLPLPAGPLTLRVTGPFDVSALITDEGGKVGTDADFVFYNQPAAPGARLRDGVLSVDPARLRAGAARVTVVVSAAAPGTPLHRLPPPTLRVTDPAGRAIAAFSPPRPERETVLLLAELYRRGPGWKLRALGQGYADGLAGLARDFGVDVTDDPQAPSPSRAPSPSPVVSSATSGLRQELSSPAPAPPRPFGPPSADPDGFLGLVNPARARAGSPPVALDARLADAARAHARAMAEAGRLGGEGRDGRSLHQRVTAAGYTYLTVGEHLVSGPRDPAEFVDYCLRTGQARRTLEDPTFTHTGLGFAREGRSGDMFWTALWATPLTPDGLARTTADVVALTNRERAAAGLRALSVDARLTAAAQAHSADMVARDFYAHTSPDGSQPWDRAAAAGSRMRTVGENIACGQRSAAEVVEGWMNSPAHRDNILKGDFTHIGVGFAGGGRSGTYWTQLFGG